MQTSRHKIFFKINSAVSNKVLFYSTDFLASNTEYASKSAYVLEVSKTGYTTKRVPVPDINLDVGVITLSAIHDSINYIPFNVGDYRQFIYSDSATIQWEIVGTALRSDGKKVFIETSQTGNETPDTIYSYDDGNYWVTCKLDSSIDSSGQSTSNPFEEQRIALKAPQEDQWWDQFENDTSSLYRVAKLYPTLNTPLGPIQNVYGFEDYDSKSDSLPFMTVCCANNIGWIGTLNGNNTDSVIAMVVYIHVGPLEKGVMIPKRDPIEQLSKTKAFNFRRSAFFLQGLAIKWKAQPDSYEIVRAGALDEICNPVTSH